MKVACLGVDVQEGKTKYEDPKLLKLVEKFSSDKVSSYFFEFVGGNYIKADAIAVSTEKLLDFLILDMEKIETRINNTTDETEKQILQKCLQNLEKEIPLCDVEFQESELVVLRALAPLSLKPTLIIGDRNIPISALIEEVLKKSNNIFFYTAAKKEVKAWLVKKDSQAIECAGKIHSDLARGFIKAEIVNFTDFESCHNMNDAKSKGLVKLVDKDCPVRDGDILDIKFNV